MRTVTTWEQRERMYKDLRELLDPGILSHVVTVSDVRMCFRTLNPSDLYLLKHYTQENDPNWRMWAAACSLWMCNGVNLLPGGHAHVPFVAKMFLTFPRVVQDRVFSVVTGLFSRSKRAFTYLEPFFYEDESRKLWHAVGKETLNGGLAGGLEGIRNLGLNGVQSSWITWNQLEDERNINEMEWSRVRAGMMVHLQKESARKLGRSEEDRRDREAAYRQSVMDKAFFTFCGILTEDTHTLSRRGRGYVLAATTDEELQSQYEQWKRGEDDFHDNIVKNYKDWIRERFDAEARARERARLELEAERKRMETTLGVKPAPLVGYTLEQLKAFHVSKPHRRTIYDGNKAQAAFQKFIEVSHHGNLPVQNDSRDSPTEN